jgi:hypothetical protein
MLSTIIKFYGVFVKIICFSIVLQLGSCYNKSIEKTLRDDKLDSLSGTYDSPFNAQGVCYGTIDIKYETGRIIYFDIETGRVDGCTGKLIGEVSLDSNLKGTYFTDVGTTIIFEFSKQSLHLIEQVDCQEHGMRCWFDGEYVKCKK